MFVEGVNLLYDLGVQDEMCPIVESRLAWWHPMWPKGFHQSVRCGKMGVPPTREGCT